MNCTKAQHHAVGVAVLAPSLVVPYAGNTLWFFHRSLPVFRIIGALFSGLLVGVIARFLYWGSVPMGWWMTIFLGMGGSLLADAVVNRGRPARPAGFIASVLGAIALIFVGRHLGWG